jgi:hypothetical protein
MSLPPGLLPISSLNSSTDCVDAHLNVTVVLLNCVCGVGPSSLTPVDIRVPSSGTLNVVTQYHLYRDPGL